MPLDIALLSVQSLVKTYEGQDKPVVEDVNFTIQPGEFFTLLGPSGCGKTTTLRMIAGLERPDKGRIALDNDILSDSSDRRFTPPHRRNIAMVFQSYAIWPHMTVLQNVLFPLETLKLPQAERERRARAALERVGLESFATRSATMLSGGQQQRVALARAIVREAKLILLDEPLSNLDAALREQMRIELRHLQRQIGTTAVYVTHDQEEAMALSDRVAVMKGGRIADIGTPERLFSRPADAFVARFLGSTQEFRAQVSSHERNSTLLQTELGPIAAERNDLPAGIACRLFIRPEHIECSAPGGGAGEDEILLRGRVREARFFGRMISYRIAVGAETVEALATSARSYEPGQDVDLRIPRRHLMVFRVEAE